jgi:O-antigen/teichoic acid export membrane protein
MQLTVKETTIVSNIFWKFLKGFLQLFTTILIFRNINISDYGLYITAISVFELAAIFSLPGVIKIALRSALSNDGRFRYLLGLKFLFLPVLLFGFIFVPSWIALPILIATIADQVAMFARVKLNEHKQYLAFNIFENLKPFLLILGVSINLFIFSSEITLKYLLILYCFSSIVTTLLNILFAKKQASFSLKISIPKKADISQSFYASGNGLIGTFVRRGVILITALTLSTTEVAYLNIMLQVWTIFTMLYSGLSLSLTRDIYDNSLTFKQIRSTYLQPMIILIFSLLISSILFYTFGGFFLSFIFGEDSLGAKNIIHLSPLILLFQLPQLILIGVLMRQKKEKLILFLNCLSILIFAPILIIFTFSLLSLVKILLGFVTFVSFIYCVAFLKPNFFKYAR